jgi:hypothetical protein
MLRACHRHLQGCCCCVGALVLGPALQCLLTYKLLLLLQGGCSELAVSSPSLVSLAWRLRGAALQQRPPGAWCGGAPPLGPGADAATHPAA